MRRKNKWLRTEIVIEIEVRTQKIRNSEEEREKSVHFAQRIPTLSIIRI